MSEFIEVKVESLNSNWGTILRITEKNSQNPRFFDVIIDLASAQHIFFLQSEKGQKEIKQDLLFEIWNVCGIKMKEVRIIDYKDEKIISEILVSAPNKADQTINCKFFIRGIVVGLMYKARILIKQEVLDKIIAVSQKAAEKMKKQAAEDYKVFLEKLKDLNQIPISSVPPQEEREEGEEQIKDKSIV